jgi:RNA polymerase-binding transcription factor DksA
MPHEHHKEALHRMQAELATELESLGVHDPHNTSDWIATPSVSASEPDHNDAADMVEELEERESTLAVLETRWNDIRRALEKMEAGTFGICEIGGEPIEEVRLSVNPSARTCIAHKEREVDLSL